MGSKSLPRGASTLLKPRQTRNASPVKLMPTTLLKPTMLGNGVVAEEGITRLSVPPAIAEA